MEGTFLNSAEAKLIIIKKPAIRRVLNKADNFMSRDEGRGFPPLNTDDV